MLQLKTKELDIARISKLLVKYNINARVSNQVITLEGDISDELLNKLCNGITICNVQNFSSEISSITQTESIFFTAEETISNITDKPTKGKQEVILAPQIIQKYDLRYPIVKRGEVYLCDFGEPYGYEQGYMRYAIVIQNDDANINSLTTIVLPCTTQQKKDYPFHYHFVFSDENMIDYDVLCVGVKQNVVKAEQIRTVDKTRLRKYLGTMTPEFMDIIQNIIDNALHLTRTERVI